MCITFIYQNPEPSPGYYRFILAMNRDEFFKRETEEAKWINGVICGRDMTPGKEGGTWLGMSKAGKIGMLTNVSTGKPEVDGKGRGFLIHDFLNSNLSAEKYIKILEDDTSSYNPFNICLFDLSQSKGYYYCRGKEGHVTKSEGPNKIDENFFGLSNHPLSKPFQKTISGLESFKSIVMKNKDTKDLMLLKQRLIDVMTNKTRFLNDPQMKIQYGSHSIPESVSSVFVDIPGIYGTRVQTFIFVDFNFNVEFHERILIPKKNLWKEHQFKFTIPSG